MLGTTASVVLLAAALVTHVVAMLVHACRRPSAASRAWLAVGVLLNLAFFALTLRREAWPMPVPAGIGVFMCLAVSYLVDVHRGVIEPRGIVAAVLFIVQLPVFPAGPLSRFHDFRQQLGHTDVSMASFSYGVRRVVTGLMKVWLIAGPLQSTADRIFALRVTRLSTDTAWLGAICAALEVYFYLSGFSDVGIGLGRIVGFRHQENFRRPYAADSIREFWRRWNVTLVTWLRDYMGLPIAGHSVPTPRVFAATIAGFVVVGLWWRSTWFVLPWAVYTAMWLAIEALGVGALLHRLPRAVRHAYVLMVVTMGWVLLRATGPGPLLGYAESLVGFSIEPFGASGVYLTWTFVAALLSAVVFAGPIVGNISRWRVSVDAATASLLMMMAATGVLMWQGVTALRVVFSGGSSDKRR